VSCFFQRNVVGLSRAVMSKLSVRPRVKLIAVVGVNNVTRGASARPIVSRLIVRAKQGKHRIEQTCLLQAQEHRIGSKQSSKPARAEKVLSRLARRFFRIGKPDFSGLAPASFERAKGVAHVSYFPTRQWIQIWENAFLLGLFFGRRRNRD